MGFLQNYADKFALEPLSPSKQSNLDALEQKLDEITKDQNLSFDDVLKEYQPQVMDLINRLKTKFSTWKFSWAGIWDSFQFVKSIALEVVQMVNAVESKIVDPAATPEANEQKKIQFSTETVYFIWSVVGPLDKYCNWIPFKKTIEKKLVLWLAGAAVKASFNFFNANKPKTKLEAPKKGKNVKLKRPTIVKIVKSFK